MASAKAKRANFPRTCDYTKAFQKDYERLSRSGRYDMNRLKEVMLLLIANEPPLGAEWLDVSAQRRMVGLPRMPRRRGFPVDLQDR